MKKVRLQKRTLRFRPQFKGPIEGYLVNTINRNYWRVEKVMSREDLYQDGVMIFCLVRTRYARIVDNPAWFMSLYKRALNNHIHDVARVQRKLSEQDALPDQIESTTDSIEAAEVAGLFEQAPPEVAEIVRLFLYAPVEVWQVLSKAWNARGNRAKKGKETIARALGKSDDFDARKVVHKYLDGYEEG